jgi:hypothetical protein
VFEDSVRPLVEHALGGGHATAFMFGQTGSGKTYTMGAMYERAARLCFPPLEGGGGGVYVSFVELAGEGAGRDLLVSRSQPCPAPGPSSSDGDGCRPAECDRRLPGRRQSGGAAGGPDRPAAPAAAAAAAPAAAPGGQVRLPTARSFQWVAVGCGGVHSHPLTPSGQVRLLTDSAGNVQLHGQLEVRVTTCEQVLQPPHTHITRA